MRLLIDRFALSNGLNIRLMAYWKEFSRGGCSKAVDNGLKPTNGICSGTDSMTAEVVKNTPASSKLELKMLTGVSSDKRLRSSPRMLVLERPMTP